MFKKLFALSGFKIALMITLVIIFIFGYAKLPGAPLSDILNLPDKKWIDFILKGRGTQPHTSEVVIATIDTKSVDTYGRWPWPRGTMAKLVKTLNDYYEVTTIGFDIVFSEPEHGGGLVVTDKYKEYFSKLKFNNTSKASRFVRFLDQNRAALDGDTEFGKVLAENKNVILGYLFFSNPSTLEHLSEADIAKSAEGIAGSEISLLKGTIASGVIPKGYAPETNIPKIYKGGFLSGFFNVNPDSEDGTVRRIHLLMRYKENIYPNLDLQILKHYYGADNIIVEADSETNQVVSIQVGNQVFEPDFDGSIMLNYKGGEKTFAHYSIADIIAKTIPIEDLEGRIVLVGATEPGIFDLRTTPVGVAYPGVEIHATLLDNLLDKSYFKLSFANHMASMLLILGVGLLLGIVLPRVKASYAALLTIGLMVAYVAGHRWMVMNWLTWTSAFFVLLVIVMVWSGVTLFQYLVSDKDRRFIKGAFQQYLSPEVIGQLMDNPDLLKLGGERREMTAFFSDVQGFSTISEALTPEQLVSLLNKYLTQMSNIIMDYGGTVDKYEGDAIIAFFGAPMHYEDHAIRACHVTVDMQRLLDTLRVEWMEEGLPRIDHRIGLNTGQMIVGNMGSENRFDYTMMGNSVNLAARLEGANKNYGTYSMISEMTLEPAKDAVEVRELDLIRVMGINKPVRVYELLAKKGELTEEQTKGIAYFAKGLELYRDMNWDEAKKYFKAVYKFLPDDPPAKTFIVRCDEFTEKPPEVPPGEPWDGVFTAGSK